MQRQLKLKALRVSLALAASVVVSLFALPDGPAQAQTSAPPSRAAGLLSSAIEAAEARDWQAAHARAAQSAPIAQDLLQWQALRAGEGSFAQYQAFLRDKGHWPLINAVARHAEEMLATQSAETVLAFFNTRAPVSEAGMMAQVFALRDKGRTAEAEALAARLWREELLGGESELQLLRSFESVLSPHHAARVDMLLWRNERAAARRHLERLDRGARAVAQARLGLQERVDGVTALVAAVPAAVQGDPGLMHDRFTFRMRAGNHEGAEELILAQSRAPQGLGNADAWGRDRVFLVRRALSEGAYQRAYDLAAPHGLEDGLHFVDLEFLAGFVALEFLGNPAKALPHFRALQVRSSSPITLGRAGFWQGRTYEALGDAVMARTAYEFGAEHQSGFYGQLAADRLGMLLDPALLAGPDYPDWRDTALARSDLLQAALLLREAGQWHEARRFILFLARQLEDEAEIGALADLMLALNEPNFALNIAKIAVQNEIILPRAYFPVTDLARAAWPVPMDLVKAIARRESEFDPAVISHADARGLMQVVPGTGQMMARKLGLAFDASDLTRNPELNARLGAAYLEDLRAEFGSSLALVAAGYNAGPGRPRQWIPRLGDPRDPNVDILRWVETVPFAETRNYIMRVAESLVIYRALLAGSPQPIQMERLLRGG
ncbi:MAG: lytic transglycosylase domain-containing protein [Roseinatronobacter sp.]|nr:lytic transglycosylase domain-containing protein [Roseinatronobacter sp.]